jgi:hypothetical protein
MICRYNNADQMDSGAAPGDTEKYEWPQLT